MNIWQADFYYHPSAAANQKQWLLVICRGGELNAHQIEPIYLAECTAESANAEWLKQKLLEVDGGQLPEEIQVFRPQALGLISVAAASLGIKVKATRNTPQLKQVLADKYQQNPHYNPLALEKPPPQALPENLWGDEWQIANIAAGQIIDLFRDRPIPIASIPQELDPVKLNLTSDIFIPGVVVFGGRKSMQLARWIDEQVPALINYIPTEVGKSGGFILETGLVDRWIFNT
ncbi:MAG: Tab2 family RNA-binding protein, partial [Cyanobacteria bacterium J06623_7]